MNQTKMAMRALIGVVIAAVLILAGRQFHWPGIEEASSMPNSFGINDVEQAAPLSIEFERELDLSSDEVKAVAFCAQLIGRDYLRRQLVLVDPWAAGIVGFYGGERSFGIQMKCIGGWSGVLLLSGEYYFIPHPDQIDVEGRSRCIVNGSYRALLDMCRASLSLESVDVDLRRGFESRAPFLTAMQCLRVLAANSRLPDAVALRDLIRAAVTNVRANAIAYLFNYPDVCRRSLAEMVELEWSERANSRYWHRLDSVSDTGDEKEGALFRSTTRFDAELGNRRRREGHWNPAGERDR